jgi:hypothetical protein
MIRAVGNIYLIFVLLLALWSDPITHMHRDSGHGHLEGDSSLSSRVLHWHFEESEPDWNIPAGEKRPWLSADHDQDAQYISLFSLVPNAPSSLPFLVEHPFVVTLSALPEQTVWIKPTSTHDPPTLFFSIPRSPPA